MKARNIALFALPLLALACDALVGNEFTINDAVCSSDSDCSAVKPAANMKTASCEESTCRIGQCNAGFANCNGDLADGCEVDMQSDAQNCGTCSLACALPDASPACANGTCVIASCNVDHADCDKDASNGCEVDNSNDPSNCGACGTACMVPSNGAPACKQSQCTVGACASGFEDCNGDAADGCEASALTYASDINNCGGCGKPCNPPNATAGCTAGICGIGQCKAGFEDCNGKPSDGCEASALTYASDIKNCGSCGNACGALANATAGCTAGTCGIGQCNAGFDNCDDDAADGCESKLATDDANCGSCGNACGATSQCKSGACQVCPLKLLAKVDYAVGDFPYSVTAGDLNGDGKLDLAAANGNSGTVSVLLGNGDGTFKTKLDYPVGNGPSSVTAADLNGDGKLDLAAANGGSDTVSVLLGNGNGTFKTKVDYGVGDSVFLDSPRSVTTGDLNGDGKLDLATANVNSDRVSVRLGNGDGTFIKINSDYYVGDGPLSVTTGDLNGDGKLDLATTNFISNTVTVLLGNGDGTFKTEFGPYVGDFPRSVTAGDLNGDGKLDLATANAYSDTVSVLLGNGDGTYKTKVDYLVGEDPYSVTTADLNGDGKLDLATANYNSNTGSVLLGNGDGTFKTKVDYPVGDGAFSITTGDLNGDGKLDLATANSNSDTVSVLLNGACLP